MCFHLWPFYFVFIFVSLQWVAGCWIKKKKKKKEETCSWRSSLAPDEGWQHMKRPPLDTYWGVEFVNGTDAYVGAGLMESTV